MSATEFCGADAPKTWVGVYDNVFLEKAAELIQKQDSASRNFISSIRRRFMVRSKST